MKRIAIATSLLVAACTGEADIGISSAAMTCSGQTVTEAHGTIKSGQLELSFGATQHRLTTQPVALTIFDNQLMLDIGFQCGAPTQDHYQVMPVTPQVIDCPLAVTGTVTGQIEFVEARDGTLIVDEVSNCLAGRFAIDFGDHGSVSGKFSVPWQ